METASRLAGFGQTIFTEMSRIAHQHGAINLGQGFPNFDGPEFVKEAALEAMRAGANQYAPMAGIPELRAAIGDRWKRDTGREIDIDAEVTVTSGCTEALAAAALGLLEPGDEVILLEPYYDSYPACLAMAGARARHVRLRPPAFALEEEMLSAAIGQQTRAIIVNTPHNPTGRVLSRAELETVARLCRDHDLLAITDEVYERLVYEGEHLRLGTLDGMAERTLTLSSLGKTFSLTGWKVGWAIGPEPLISALRSAHQFLTFATATPLQHGAVAALRAPDQYYRSLVDDYRERRDLLVSGLAGVGFDVIRPEGTYFVLAHHTPFGDQDDVTFCRRLIEEAGVAAIPPSVFYHDRGERSLVRFAFCKDVDTLGEAVDRLSALS